MTLLEALVALVVLGLGAVGFLQLFQGTSRSARDAEAWVHAVAYAEAAMEESKLGAGPASDVTPADAVAFPRTVEVAPWPELPGLEVVTVTVALPGGGAFELHRLVRGP